MRLLLPLALAALSCGPDLKTPTGAAEAFADRYYVESNLQKALELTSGAARERLARELGLAAEARGGGQTPQEILHAKVYYERGEVKETEPGKATAGFRLRIQPPEGGAVFHKDALLSLERSEGRWRVVDFAESAAQ